MAWTRRSFLAAGSATAAALMLDGVRAAEPAAAEATSPALPLLDLHVHLDNSTIEQVLEISRQRGVKFGIVEHAGTKENIYPVVLSSDAELGHYLDMLEGKPVYRGVQTEWTDWEGCFSRAALARLDYVLTDAMTYPGKDGRRVKLWENDAPQRVDMSDAGSFMDRYVEWYLQIIERQPVDVMANVSWLPAPLAADYDTLWTADRIRRVAESAARHRVALEISSGYRLPTLRFLQVAKSCGVRFTFGTNGRYPRMGQLDYSLQMARELKLTPDDLFQPDPLKKRAAAA